MALANAVGSSRMVGMISYPPKAESTYRELRNYVFWPKNASVNLSTISSCTFPKGTHFWLKKFQGGASRRVPPWILLH